MKRFWALPIAMLMALTMGLNTASAVEPEPTPEFDPPAAEETPTAPQNYYPSSPAPNYNTPAPKPKPKKKPLKTKKGLLILSDIDVARALLTSSDFKHAAKVGAKYGINAATSPAMLVRVPFKLLKDPRVIKNNPELVKALAAGVVPRVAGAAAGGVVGAVAGGSLWV